MELRVVQSVDVCSQRAPELARKRAPIGNRTYAREARLKRLQTLPLDRGLVHEAGVVIANLALLGAGRGMRRGLLEQ